MRQRAQRLRGAGRRQVFPPGGGSQREALRTGGGVARKPPTGKPRLSGARGSRLVNTPGNKRSAVFRLCERVREGAQKKD